MEGRNNRLYFKKKATKTKTQKGIDNVMYQYYLLYITQKFVAEGIAFATC